LDPCPRGRCSARGVIDVCKAGGSRRKSRSEIQAYHDYPGAYKRSCPINDLRNRRDYRAFQALYVDLLDFIATPPPEGKHKKITWACIQGANRPRIGNK
jgi:hypothetical protein